MRIIFGIPENYKEAIDDILNQCGESCFLEKKENLSGDQIIAIVAIITPIVWALVEKYLPDRMITIQKELDEKTIVTISDRLTKRAFMKLKETEAEWLKLNK